MAEAQCEAKTVPRHVAIIMDGNGRWANRRGLPRIKGHEEGAESVRAVLRTCREVGVQYLTLYAFSSENWSRPWAEVESLMRLLVKFLRTYERELHENCTRLHVIGDVSRLSSTVRRQLTRVINATREYDRNHLTLALSYGSRDELVRAVQKLARKVQAGELAPEAIDAQAVSAHLDAPELPDPDLLIRTSGEIRISNFMLWQISYAELYFTDTVWPEFREAEFRQALADFARRDRRFGGLGGKAGGRGAAAAPDLR